MGIGYFAQFGVTEQLVQDTIAAALSRGGDHADVYFQHSVSSDVRVHVAADLPDRFPLVRPWDEVRPDEKLPLVAALNARAFAADPRVKKVNVYLRDEAGAILVADSSGRMVEDEQPMTLLFLSLLAEEGGRREQNGYNVAGRAGFEFYSPDRLDRVVREAVARTTILFEAGPPPAGEMPVVLAAGSSGILLHEAIGHGMEADFNRKGVSIYADKIGKPIARPFVNIVDDAATPRMRSTYMLPGPHRTEEIIRSVKKGIYCANFSNGQVAIGAGDFTFYVKNGWLIEDGKLTKRSEEH